MMPCDAPEVNAYSAAETSWYAGSSVPSRAAFGETLWRLQMLRNVRPLVATSSLR
jgi:hypothetical protein